MADAVADHVISAQNSVLFPNSPQSSKRDSVSSTAGREGIAPLSPTNGSSQDESSKRKKKKRDKKEKKEADRRFRIAISGGSLVHVLHQGLLKRDDVFWGKWDVYFADERLVPFEDPQSNYGLAKRELFDQIADSPSGVNGQPKVYHVDETLLSDPEACAEKYEKVLVKNFAFKDLVKLPMFDLILLGCAPDGHVALLFPAKEQLREEFAWVISVTNAPRPPAERITLTVPVICHSSRVTFVVEGPTKAPILKTVFERPDKGLPSSILNEGAAGRVSWFVDEDALDDVMVGKKRYKYEVDTFKN